MSGYSSDSPLVDPRDDKVGRAFFSKRVADALAARTLKDSLVVALYAEWGDGKTTVLNFIESHLSKRPELVLVKFNPWAHGKGQSVERAFMNAVAKGLERSLKTGKERLGEVLATLGSLVPSSTARVDGGALNVSSSVFQGVGAALSSTELSTLKKRLAGILEEEGRRVVVFIDDLDRVDVEEIQTVFKLIKMAADFDYTTYVLSFDFGVVSEALSKIFPGSPALGATFVEKIVQVPLRLPRIEPSRLRQILSSAIEAVLKKTELQIEFEDYKRFQAGFDRLIATELRTLRQAKRYLNAVEFVLPILGNEANTADILLAEALRVFFPMVYEALGASENRIFAARELTDELLADLVQTVPADSQEQAIGLLTALLPQLRTLKSDDEQSLRVHQRMASPMYFPRFFSFGLPPGDVSDVQVKECLASKPIPRLMERFPEASAHQIIEKIHRAIPEIASGSSLEVVCRLIEMGNALGSTIGSDPLSVGDRLCALCVKLIGEMATTKERTAAATSALREATEAAVLWHLSRHLSFQSVGKPEEAYWTVEGLKEVQKVAADRIDLVLDLPTLYLSSPSFAGWFYVLRSQFPLSQELRDRVLQSVKEQPSRLMKFATCFFRNGGIEKAAVDAFSAYLPANELRSILPGAETNNGHELAVHRWLSERLSQEKADAGGTVDSGPRELPRP